MVIFLNLWTIWILEILVFFFFQKKRKKDACLPQVIKFGHLGGRLGLPSSTVKQIKRIQTWVFVVRSFICSSIFMFIL